MWKSSPRLNATLVYTVALFVLVLAAGATAQTLVQTFLRIRIGTGLCQIRSGSGTPEGAVVGKVCDVYLRTDGATGTVIYQKASGTGNTGWEAAGAGGGGGGGGASDPGAFVLLEQHTAAASASLDFVSAFSSTYDEYVIEVVNLTPATSTTNLLMRVSTNGGSSYDSGSNYEWARYLMQSAAASSGGSTSDTSIVLGSNITNGSSDSISGSFRLTGAMQATKRMLLVGNAGYYGGGPSWNAFTIAGAYKSLASVNAVQFLMSSGNIASGTIRIYGIAKTATVGVTTISTGTWATRPTAGVSGRVYLPNDGYTIARDSGTAWETFGPVFPFTPPSDTGFSWVNQGSSTITTTQDALVLVGAASGNTANFVLRVKTTPATPYTVTAYMVAPPFAKNNHNWGLCLRQNGAGSGQNRIRLFGHAQAAASATIPGSLIVVWGTVGATTGISEFGFGQPLVESVKWFRIADNGTNLTYSISADGQTWTALYTEARTAYLLQGPDQIGFCVGTQNTATPNLDQAVTVLSWLEQ